MEWRGDDIDPEHLMEHEEGADDAIAKVKELKKELDKLRTEKQEYMDGWQRAKADYVNALKRFEEEKKSEKARGVTKAVEALLPAYDALERAKEHGEVPPGFEAIVKQLESAFTSLGLESLGEVGQKFDPAIHEAFGQDQVASPAQDDQVTAILEKGWKLGDSIIRAAKVRVGHFAG